MARRRNISTDDVREICRLAREVCELGDDPIGWRWHMLARLSALAAAAAARSTLARSSHGEPSAQDVLLLVSWDADQRSAPAVGASPPVSVPSLTVQSPVPDTTLVQSTSLWRRPGAPAFDARDQRLVRLLHDELQHLWQTPACVPELRMLVPLAPRQRQVAMLLVQGLAERQVASRLGISRHTVHNYVRSLYRKLAVNSQAELIVRLCPRPAFRPRLLPDELVPPAAGRAAPPT